MASSPGKPNNVNPTVSVVCGQDTVRYIENHLHLSEKRKTCVSHGGTTSAYSRNAGLLDITNDRTLDSNSTIDSNNPPSGPSQISYSLSPNPHSASASASVSVYPRRIQSHSGEAGFTHLSLAGAAGLEFLEQRRMPGIEVSLSLPLTTIPQFHIPHTINHKLGFTSYFPY